MISAPFMPAEAGPEGQELALVEGACRRDLGGCCAQSDRQLEPPTRQATQNGGRMLGQLLLPRRTVNVLPLEVGVVPEGAWGGAHKVVQLR